MENNDTFIADEPIIVPTRTHSALSIFLGKWALTGAEDVDALLGPVTAIKGIETYEWFSGGFFMVHKWDRHFGEVTQIGMSIICYDEATLTYKINSYDNMGYQKCYQISNENDTWKFAGKEERATIKFDSDGTRFSETWEILKNGTWHHLCALNAEKVG